MKKRSLAILLAMSMVFSAVPVTAAAAENVDLEDVQSESNQDAACTKGQLMYMLWQACGEPEYKEVTEFEDISTDDYYYDAVMWACETGVGSGFRPDEFRPETECTRGYMITYLWRAAGKPEPTSDEMPFHDVDSMIFYGDAVKWACENNLIQDISSGYFYPDEVCTQAVLQEFIDRAETLLARKATLSESAIELKEGDTHQLTLVVTPEAENAAVTWTSSDKNVASVDENGLVTAGYSGTAEIIVTVLAGSIRSAVCTVTVSSEYGANVISISEMTVTAGESLESETPEWAVDGDKNTAWHTNENENHDKHWYQLKLSSAYMVDSLKYLPTQNEEDGIITKYEVQVSLDGKEWTMVTDGSWAADNALKEASFDAVKAKFVRLIPLEATGDQELVSVSAAEIRLTGTKVVCAEGTCGEETIVIEKKDKTFCTDEGYTGDTVCKECYAVKYKGSINTPNGHYYDEWVEVEAPAEGKAGIKERTCCSCSYTQRKEVNAILSLNNPCTRGQLMYFLWKANGAPEYTEVSEFEDISPDDYYYDAVMWSLENGISTSYTDTTFRPEVELGRAYVITFLWIAAGRPEAVMEDIPFIDVGEYEFYKIPIRWAYENQIISESEDRCFYSKEICTLGEALEFIQKTYDLQETVFVPLTHELSLNEASLSLNGGETYQLIPTFEPETMKDTPVKWKSSEESVATIDENGVITAHYGGTTEITCVAQDGSNASTTCVVTVDPENARSIVPVSNITTNWYGGSCESDKKPENVLDYNNDTGWQVISERIDEKEHCIELKLYTVYTIDGLRYLPYQDGTAGTITEYKIQTSLDGSKWDDVASGSWENDSSWKEVQFDAVNAKYVRLISVNSMSGNTTKRVSAAAEIRLTGSRFSDKEALNAVIEIARTKVEADYPGDIWTKFMIALEDAERILGMDDAIQEAIDDVTETLLIALIDLDGFAGLVEPFDDVQDETAYYYEPVYWAVLCGITTGYVDNLFAPEVKCTRAQAVTFLWRAAGQPRAEQRTHAFTDVDENQFYYEAMLWAVENGITTGYTTTTFAPDVKCTRGQIVTFLHRALGKPTPSITTHPFTDADYRQYYYDAMLWAVGENVTTGYTTTTFAPDTECTRAQIVTFLYRAIY